MVNTEQFKAAANLAVLNIIKHGDTDIFPFPFETHAFYDKKEKMVKLIEEYNSNFDEYLNRFSPINVSSLTPVSYSGFRWATQLDPMWNAYFLTCVLALSKIELVRIPSKNSTVFS